MLVGFLEDDTIPSSALESRSPQINGDIEPPAWTSPRPCQAQPQMPGPPPILLLGYLTLPLPSSSHSGATHTVLLASLHSSSDTHTLSSRPHSLDPDPASTPPELCDLQQVTQPLWASVASSVKWGWEQSLLERTTA